MNARESENFLAKPVCVNIASVTGRRHITNVKVDIWFSKYFFRKKIYILKQFENLHVCMHHGPAWIRNRHGHECSRIWKFSGNFTLIQCIKKCRDIWAEIYRERLFLVPNLVSFNRAVVPYEISKVIFRVETTIIVSIPFSTLTSRMINKWYISLTSLYCSNSGLFLRI
jgi:hypothetical protein